LRYFSSSPGVIRLEVGTQAVALIPSEHRTERHCHGKSNGRRKIVAVRFDLMRQWQRAVSSTPHSVVAESSVGYEMTLDGEELWRESAELIQWFRRTKTQG
jgi:hypothetical protein